MRYVEKNGLWVPEYTVGSGLGDWVARGLHKLGFKQKGCGCEKRQRWFNELTGRPRGHVLPISGGANGDESLCLSLGANCVCNEPLTATSYTQNGGFWWIPNDTNTKPCISDTVRGIQYSQTLTASSDPAVLARLPNASITRFLRSPDNHVGGWTIGTSLAPTLPGAIRVALRWYAYHSSDYSMKGDTDLPGFLTVDCNSKIAETNGVQTIFDYTAGVHSYLYTNWSPPQDCCVGGGPDGWASAESRNAWWRWELVIIRSGAGSRNQLFAKNITLGTPERTVFDTATQFSGSVVNGTYNGLWINLFRAGNNGSVCRGFAGISHVLIAAWATNAGQRIGAAIEMEGDGGPPPPVVPKARSLGGGVGFAGQILSGGR